MHNSTEHNSTQITQDTSWLPQIDLDHCNGCGLCIEQCPSNALGWRELRAAVTAPEKCTYCATCESICPTAAIELPYLICISREHSI